jgi:hypothetical protein
MRKLTRNSKHPLLPLPCLNVSCNNRCLFFRRLKINHESHDSHDSGTVANSYCERRFKGTPKREILPLGFFIRTRPRTPDSYPKAVSNINSNSLKNSNLQSIPRCSPPWKIGLFLQARADLKPECYNPCVVFFHHTYILHRLPL